MTNDSDLIKEYDLLHEANLHLSVVQSYLRSIKKYRGCNDAYIPELQSLATELKTKIAAQLMEVTNRLEY